MCKLADIYIKNMPNFMKKKLVDTHSEFFLAILREYDEEIGKLFNYGTITYRMNCILVGTEYEYRTIDMTNHIEAERCFQGLVSEKGQLFSLKELYQLANSEETDGIYIPVYVDRKKLFCVCNEKKEDVLSYLELNEGIEIYEKYPLLVNILKWGISYILPNDIHEKTYDRVIAKNEKSAKYIRIKSTITDLMFREMKLPYLSTIQSIASWNYEGKASYGYIDFENPFSHEYMDKELTVKFEEPFILDESRTRTIRKYVELSDEKLRLRANSAYSYLLGDIADDEYWSIVGLGKNENEYATIRFEGRCCWRLYLKKEIIIYDGSTFYFRSKKEKECQYKKNTELFFEALKRLTCEYDQEIVIRINSLIELASNQKHGTMIIFLDKAAEEAERLCGCGRGIKINPLDFKRLLKEDAAMARKTIENLSKIDGALIFDLQGICYSIGTIVDGRACKHSNPGRGARYNSAYTYVNDCDERGILCYVAIVSEDETIDVFGTYGRDV